MKIYVSNLSFDTEDATLRGAFEKHGEVTGLRVMRRRATASSLGCGVVEMTSETEANAAIDALDGSQLDGRTITVGKADEVTLTDPDKVREWEKPNGSQGARHVGATVPRSAPSADVWHEPISLRTAGRLVIIAVFLVAIFVDLPHLRIGANITTNTNSFLSGVAGPLYVAIRCVIGLLRDDVNVGRALGDTWESGSPGYKIGFLLGCCMVVAFTSPVLFGKRRAS